MDQPSENLYISNMERTIRTYNLFGEIDDLPDVVHCERIETRSRLHDWEFKPHRHARLHQILLVQSGGGQADLDGTTLPLAPPCLINVPLGIVHGFSFHPGTTGWVVTIGAELMDDTQRPGEGVRSPLCHASMQRPDEDLVVLIRRIFAEYHGQNFARAQVLRSLCGTLLGLVARQIEADALPPADGVSDTLARRFDELLEQHYSAQWSVAQYADALSITPTHLTRTIKSATGQTPRDLIANRVLREARRMLIYTNLSVAQIGYDLGYHDPAHFSRVVKQGVGLSPAALRRKLRAS